MDSTINGIKRQACEIWSRVVGYLRPISQYNKGKKEEWKDRKTYTTDTTKTTEVNKEIEK